MQLKLDKWFNSLVSGIGKARLYICCFSIIPLILLGQKAKERKVFDFEIHFLQWLQDVIPPIIGRIFALLYFIGDTEFAAFVVVVSLAVLCYKRYWREAMTLAFAALSVLLLVDRILKPFFARRRPPERIDKSAIGYGFPSGHATGNVLLYFYLASLLAARYPKLRIYIYGVTTVFLILMGISSMYLRVHWPTDIIAGYLFGYIWLTVCLALLNSTDKKREKY